MNNSNLSYWKGRKLDADQAIAQARMHLRQMILAKRKASREVKELEKKILV